MKTKFYSAPEVEIVEVSVESGFAATDGIYGDDLTPGYPTSQSED